MVKSMKTSTGYVGFYYRNGEWHSTKWLRDSRREALKDAFTKHPEGRELAEFNRMSSMIYKVIIGGLAGALLFSILKI